MDKVKISSHQKYCKHNHFEIDVDADVHCSSGNLLAHCNQFIVILIVNQQKYCYNISPKNVFKMSNVKNFESPKRDGNY